MTLIAHYPLQEDSGSTAYDLAGSNNGTVNGATVGASGVLGTDAYEFDGVDDYVGSIGDIDLSRYTLSCWVRTPSSFGSGQFRGIIFKESSYELLTDNTSPPEIRFQNADGSGGYVNFDSNPLDTDTWYMLTQTYDGGTLTGYVDASEVGSVSASLGSSNNSVEIARNQRDSANWLGKIADVRIYDHALTPGEIQFIYQSVVSRASLTSGWKGL